MVLWVFGYGSLIWNPGFDFDEKFIGFIRDYKRVFDLACIDHRGTPENPARTVTLEAKKGAICWGAAYCVKGGTEKERETMQYLEKRECEYDMKASVDFFKEGDPHNPTARVVVFISTPDKEVNSYYLGPAPLEEKARQIATATGPCGNNRDYLFRLEKAMFDIGHEDFTVIELADEVRRVLNSQTQMEEKAAAGSRQASLPKPALLPLTYLALLKDTALCRLVMKWLRLEERIHPKFAQSRLRGLALLVGREALQEICPPPTSQHSRSLVTSERMVS